MKRMKKEDGNYLRCVRVNEKGKDIWEDHWKEREEERRRRRLLSKRKSKWDQIDILYIERTISVNGSVEWRGRSSIYFPLSLSSSFSSSDCPNRQKSTGKKANGGSMRKRRDEGILLRRVERNREKSGVKHRGRRKEKELQRKRLCVPLPLPVPFPLPSPFSLLPLTSLVHSCLETRPHRSESIEGKIDTEKRVKKVEHQFRREEGKRKKEGCSRGREEI